MNAALADLGGESETAKTSNLLAQNTNIDSIGSSQQPLYHNPSAEGHANNYVTYDHNHYQPPARTIKSEIFDHHGNYTSSSAGMQQPLPLEASNANQLPYYYLPSMDNHSNNSSGQLPAGFNPQASSSSSNFTAASSSATYLPPSNPPNSLGYPQPPMPITNTAQFPTPYPPPASTQFVSVRTQGQGDPHGYPPRYPPAAYPADLPGPSNQPIQPEYPGFTGHSSFQAQAMQLMPNLADLPSSMSTTFTQYSMANSRAQMAPPMIDLGSYSDVGQVERSVFPGSSSTASTSSYAPPSTSSQGPGDQPQQKQSIYQKIKSILRIAQIFPKQEDISENSQIKVPEQGSPSSWCHVFYYEMNERVGEPYKAAGEHVIIDGLCAPSDGTRFCLGILSNANRNPVCIGPRKQIGRGCHIFKDGDDIYLESLSESPMFVQAPLYAEFNRDHLATVYRLPQNMRIKVFDKPTFDRLVSEATSQGYNSVYTLLAMCTLRMSLVKGWGEQYRRQTITACPCWLEVQLPEPLQVLDKILMTLGGPLNDEIHSFT
uniref:MH2 domain-containing protein n=1 Tax=Ditylenchus dipsaci TaxID=166011 RepID=A0A915DCB9_9BILA